MHDGDGMIEGYFGNMDMEKPDGQSKSQWEQVPICMVDAMHG